MPESYSPRLAGQPASSWLNSYRTTRALTEALVDPLTDADATIQSMEDASPAKWHLAHTTLVLGDIPAARSCQGLPALFDEEWPFLFNSYYEAEGERIARFSRGMLSRPSLEEILGWRAHVDAAMEALARTRRLRRPGCARHRA